MQAARILYARVQFVHMCTLHVCCVERNICAAHILRLSIFVREAGGKWHLASHGTGSQVTVRVGLVGRTRSILHKESISMFATRKCSLVSIGTVFTMFYFLLTYLLSLH